MAKIIGELATMVSMRTAPFEKGSRTVQQQTGKTATAMRGLRKPVDQLHTSAGRLGKSLGALKGPLGGLLVGAAGIQSIKRFGSALMETSEAIDAIGKQAARTGFLTSDLLAFQFGAKKAGLEGERFAKALDSMNKLLGEAFIERTGRSADMIEQLGLNLDDLQAAAPADRLRMIADGLQGVADQSEKAAIAAALFGREGSKNMLNFLAGGSQGLNAMQAEARELGIALDEGAVRALERFNDQLTTFGERREGFMRQMTAEILPAMSALLDDIERVERFFGGGELQSGSNLADKFLDQVERALDPGRYLGLDIPAVGDIITLYRERGRGIREEERGKFLDDQIVAQLKKMNKTLENQQPVSVEPQEVR